MSNHEFTIQMNRMIATYGKNAYPEERCRILWREMGSLILSDFTEIVDRLIAEEARPPMIDKFRELASVARERRWTQEKKQDANDAKKFWSNLPTEEMRSICDGIRMRLTGKMSDEDFVGFQRVLGGLGGGK